MRYHFTHADRLHGRRAFAAVFDAKVRKNAGPLLVFTRPNGLPHHRLGLSVGRRVGNAVARSRTKRLIREAFRLTRHTWPVLGVNPEDVATIGSGGGGHSGGGGGGGGLDIVVAVRPHGTLTLDEIQRYLFSGVTAAGRTWEKRRRNADET
ncbi:MAG: ribonuclease P protein component [Planctomycetota bacterium]